MRPVLMLSILLAFCSRVAAKDKHGLGDGGSLRAYDGRSHKIRLVQEKIRITFVPRSTNYDVLTEYTFVNAGADCTVQMFIPVYTGGIDNNQSDLTGVKISADGFRIPVKRQVLKTPDETGDFYHDVRWNTRIKFKPQQKRHVRVRYRSNLSGSCGESLSYLLAGNSWYGRVGETSLLLVSASQKEARSASYVAGVEKSQKVHFKRAQNNAYSRWKNWNPVGAFQVH